MSTRSRQEPTTVLARPYRSTYVLVPLIVLYMAFVLVQSRWPQSLAIPTAIVFSLAMAIRAGDLQPLAVATGAHLLVRSDWREHVVPAAAITSVWNTHDGVRLGLVPGHLRADELLVVHPGLWGGRGQARHRVDATRAIGEWWLEHRDDERASSSPVVTRWRRWFVTGAPVVAIASAAVLLLGVQLAR
jgi:hypothetical protein